jgi:20S proteasome subunit alpha 4
LEQNYKEDMDREETIKLAIKSLLEVVQTGSKNIEIAVMEQGVFEELEPSEIERITKIIEQENAAQAEKKKPTSQQ